MIKAIIFDFDNTLIDRQKAFKEMLKVKIPATLPSSKAHLANQAIEDIMKWDNYGSVERTVAFKKYTDTYGLDESVGAELAASWSKESGVQVFLFDDVLEVLDYLKDKYRLALLTNGNATSQRRKLNASNILSYFEYTVVSGEIGISKPDPKAFMYVADKLGLSVDECLYIGDNYQIDIEGADSAHMPSIFVNRRGIETAKKETITELSELKKLL